MLVTLKEILTKAKQENYAVPACNIDNEHNPVSYTHLTLPTT